MSAIIRYSIYEAKIFFRVKAAVFYSIIFPVILLLVFRIANNGSDGMTNINSYFPYLVSITMISTAGGLASLIVSNRVYNMWKFYSFFGYKTWQMTIATGVIYFLLSEVICLAMSLIMIVFLHTISISFINFAMFLSATVIGTIFYIEIAIIVGLSINDPRNAQTIINGFIYLFVVLSGSLVRFSQNSIAGKIMLFFPNIHIGNLLHAIWNYNRVNFFSLAIITLYVVIFSIVISFLIKKDSKKLLY